MKGEIANYPQALINGSPVTTQADVKSRYVDGSVKHVVISFILASLSANGNAVITFANQTSGNNTPLSKSEMLATGYNFDAVIRLASGATVVSASARAMVTADKYAYWTQGPVATTVIIADHSFDRAYDMGFDANKSFRPIFHATFWPGINKVRVRFIGEISNSEVLQDQTYDLTLTTGQTSPVTAYSQAAVVHCFATRWTKEYWIGGAPATVAINHNTPYCIATCLLPNWDTTKVVSESSMASDYTAWLAKDRSVFAQAYWTYKGMGTAGGRLEIGPMTGWTVRYVMTWDNRLKEIAFGQAENTGVWPMHFREGDSSKPFLRDDASVRGVGRVVAVTGRPTLMVGDGNGYLNYNYTTAPDKITPLAATTCQWNPDCSHQPELLMVPYALTGDYWYLEQALFWASWSAAQNNGAAYSLDYGRGPTGAEGGVSDQLRGQAWKIRSRSQTAWIAPDSMPEKRYFTQLMHDAIAILEGAKNITGSAYQGNACWNWGNTKQYKGAGTLPPLHQWMRGSGAFAQWGYGIDTTVTSEAVSNFETHYFMYSIGRARELGFPADRLVEYLAQCYVSELTDPSYNPYLISNGRLPTVQKSTGQFFTNWADLKLGYQAAWQTKTAFDTGSAESYSFLALAASSMVAHEIGGTAAWSFIRDKLLHVAVLNNDARWAVNARDSVPVAVDAIALDDDGVCGITADPNPFNPMVEIRYHQIGRSARAAARADNGRLALRIYDLAGRCVVDLSDRMRNGRAVWNAGSMPSGVYVCRVQEAGKSVTKKITLLK